MNRPRSEDDVLRMLAARLGREPREGLWLYMVRRGYIADVISEFGESPEDGRETFTAVVDHYKDLEDSSTEEPSTQRPTKGTRQPQTVDEPPDERLAALSEMLALGAAKEPRVMQFRETALGGQLLTVDALAEWAWERWQPLTIFWNDVPQPLAPPTAVSDRSDEDIGRVRPSVPFNAVCGIPAGRSLTIEVPGYAPVSWSVSFGGVLDDLRVLARFLAGRYSWKEGHAAAFVLTGITPPTPLVQLSYSPNYEYPSLDMLTLKLPARLSPREVAKLYAKASRGLRSGAKERRDRPMTRKHLSLAVFRATNPGGTLKARMREWNTSHPDWRYTNVSLFSRDLRAAYSRLTGRED